MMVESDVEERNKPTEAVRMEEESVKAGRAGEITAVQGDSAVSHGKRVEMGADWEQRGDGGRTKQGQ